MRFQTAKVIRDTNHSVSTAFAPWELPILEYLYEAGNVQIQSELEVNDAGRELPEAGDEFARLVGRYGRNTDTGVSHAEEVFGRGNQGVKALAALIDNERAREKSASTKAGADELAA